METMINLTDLLKHEILDLYSVEEQIIEALPKMVEKAKNPELKKALREHLKVTEQHKSRLDKVKQTFGEDDNQNGNKGFFSRLFGGGSGGALNLQAERLAIAASALLTSNGGGGAGGAQGGTASPGRDGSTTSSTPALGGSEDSGGGAGGAGGAGILSPLAGSPQGKGGGGGGGAAGRIFFKHLDTTSINCSISPGALVSPPARGTNCP